MGFEVVYCYKCQKRLSEVDFQKGEAFRVGITTTCRKCSADLIAALPPEQQAALLAGPAQTRSTPQAVRTEPPAKPETDRLRHPADVPTPRHANAAHTKRAGGRPPAASPVAYIAAGIAALVVLLAVVLLSGGDKPRAAGVTPATAAPPPVAAGPAKTPEPPERPSGRLSSLPDTSPRRLEEAEDSLRAAREYAKASPGDLAGCLQRFERAMWDTERTPLFASAKLEYEAALAKSRAADPATPAPSGTHATPATPAAQPDATPAAASLPPPSPTPAVTSAPSRPAPPPAPALTAADLDTRYQTLRKEHDEAVRKALDAFKTSMAAASDTGARANAVEQLSKSETDVRIASELLRHLGDDIPVRRNALKGLNPYCGDEKIALAQWKTIQTDPEKMVDNLWTLFGCGHPSLAPLLIPSLKHATPEVADAAIWLLESMFCAEAVEGLLEAWEELESARNAGGASKQAAEDRLKKLYWLAPAVSRMTGQSFKTPAEYRAWWTKARASYKPAPAPRPMPVCLRHQGLEIQAGTRLPPGMLALEIWANTRHSGIDMTSGAWLKRPPSRTCVIRDLESPYCLEEYFVARIRGYLVPPADGDYRFWIAADDRGELYLSTDDTPAAKTRVAKVTVDFNYARAWDPHPDQASQPIPLKAGRRYYFETHLAENKGMDIVSVAWQPPVGRREVIPGRHLIPYDCSVPDAVAAGTALAVSAAPPSASPGAPSSALASSPAVPAPSPQGLIGWWRFDESGGEVAEDATGNGRAARLVGPVKRTLGKFGRGIQFAGDGGHVELPRTPVLDRVQAGSYALAAWFRPEAVPEAGQPPDRFAILVKAPPATGLAYNHERRFVAEHGTGGPPQLLTGAWDRECAPWSFHHVVLVVDREKGQLTFHLDGIQVDKRPIPAGAGTPDYASTPWRIGIADPASATRKWAAKGVVDEVRIYDRVLAPEEISALQKPPTVERASAPAAAPAASDAARPPAPKAASKLPPVPEPVGWWKLDETSGTVAADSSGRGQAGTVKGRTAWVKGRLGGGLRLSGDNDYVELPATDTLNRLQVEAYTLAAWYQPMETPSVKDLQGYANHGILIKAGLHTGLYFNSYNQFGMMHWLKDKTMIMAESTGPSCAPGRFYHVAGVSDPEAGEIRGYVDGAPGGVTTYKAGTPGLDYKNETWKIGIARPGDKDYRMPAKGIVDDVRLFDRALTGEEVLALFAQAGGTPSSIAAAAAAMPPPRPPATAVMRLMLVDVKMGQDLGELKNGAKVKLSALPTRNLTVRADTAPAKVGSVVLDLNGTHRQVESDNPYTLFGDLQGKHKPGELPPGTHTVTATPYTEKDGKGEAGKALTVRFQVEE